MHSLEADVSMIKILLGLLLKSTNSCKLYSDLTEDGKRVYDLAVAELAKEGIIVHKRKRSFLQWLFN